MICSCAVKAALDLDVSLIIVLTSTGHTSFQISKYRPLPLVLAVSDSLETIKYCHLGYGIKTFHVKDMNTISAEDLINLYLTYLMFL